MESDETELGPRPLYRQVRERMLARLIDGTWRPGTALPSEHELARLLGVSQGTVRKALDTLAAEHLVVRRQGRGTFVAEIDEQRILFRFFRLTPDRGAAEFPESRVVAVRAARATVVEREALGLPAPGRVVRIRRLRTLGGVPAIAETLAVPEALFPGLATGDIPNNLYALYALEYGVTIGRAVERLTAVAAAADDAALLGVAAGAPLLCCARVAHALDGTPAEHRVSLCRTDRFHYLSDLR